MLDFVSLIVLRTFATLCRVKLFIFIKWCMWLLTFWIPFQGTYWMSCYRMWMSLHELRFCCHGNAKQWHLFGSMRIIIFKIMSKKLDSDWPFLTFTVLSGKYLWRHLYKMLLLCLKENIFSFSSQKLDLFSPLLIQILQFNSFSTLTMKNY